jgi:hypothetical protein
MFPTDYAAWIEDAGGGERGDELEGVGAPEAAGVDEDGGVGPGVEDRGRVVECEVRFVEEEGGFVGREGGR